MISASRKIQATFKEIYIEFVYGNFSWKCDISTTSPLKPPTDGKRGRGEGSWFHSNDSRNVWRARGNGKEKRAVNFGKGGEKTGPYSSLLHSTLNLRHLPSLIRLLGAFPSSQFSPRPFRQPPRAIFTPPFNSHTRERPDDQYKW
jgi:hypothetical protein